MLDLSGTTIRKEVKEISMLGESAIERLMRQMPDFSYLRGLDVTHAAVLEVMNGMPDMDVLRALDSVQSRIDSLLERSPYPAFLSGGAASDLNSVIENAKGRMLNSVNLDAIEARNSATLAAVEGLSNRSVLDVLSAQQSAIVRSVEWLSDSAIWDRLQSQQTAMDRVVEQLSSPVLLGNAFRFVDRYQEIFAKEPSSLFSLVKRLGQMHGLSDNAFELPDGLESNIENSAEELSGVSDGNGFLDVFGKLPPAVQTIVLFLILQLLLPQLNSIAANLITPRVQSYLETVDVSDRQKVAEIKRISRHMHGIRTEDLRFITGNNVRLREAPSTKSPILDEMVLGQIVQVVSKERNWIEVTYEYDNGVQMHGWVFTRYTARFKK